MTQYDNSRPMCCVTGTVSELTKTPRNVIIEKGDDVHMECATNGDSSTIMWRYDGAQVTRPTCEVIDRTRFSISRSTTNECFLVGHANPARGNQGPYECSDGSGKQAEAVAVLIGNYQNKTGCKSHRPKTAKIKTVFAND